jgi:phosphoribosyl-AMP cyclohydrolase / phosphoribosyl-ATP pyrophosphohydrolase
MVISSIDLMGGKSVQLKQGKEKVLEKDDPVSLAKEFDKYGEIAVIDLDAAFGNGDNIETIKQILKVGECRVGGGIRDVKRAKELISYGARKIIIGTTAFENDVINNKFLLEVLSAVGKQRIIIAIDSIGGEIVTKGWKHNTGLKLLDTLPKLDNYCSEYLFTCVEREGMMQGIDMDIIAKIRNLTNNKVTVAGGVSTLEEIKKISEFGYDIQLGMALYTGKINLADAFVESLNWKTELLPVIAQNYSGDVLMVGFGNKESIKKTFDSGKMCYYSRSRNKLWTKGETSNNFQNLIHLRADCDHDSILAIVKQENFACHTGSFSCFGDRKFNFYELHEVLKERIATASPKSYTASLTDDKLAEKILEEAQEVVEATERDHIIWEAADVMYFLTVLLAKKGIDIDDVLFELAGRRTK